MDRKAAFLMAGRNDVRVFGLCALERARRSAVKAKLAVADRVPETGPVMIANVDFTWDPVWLALLCDRPGVAVTFVGRPARIHCLDPVTAIAVTAILALPDVEGGDAGTIRPESLEEGRVEESTKLYNATVPKSDHAYRLPLRQSAVRTIETASNDRSHTGVTDGLTLYLWRGIAFYLTRWTTYPRLISNRIMTIGIVLWVWDFFLSQDGHFALGRATGPIVMVLDTVAKRVRCTGPSSERDNSLCHGVDLIHPPFWDWAWGMGCATRLWGLGFDTTMVDTLMIILAAGHTVLRAIEGASIASVGIHIPVWEYAASRFRLVAARHNSNVILLVGSLLVMRPDLCVVAVASWTILSSLCPIVRLGQAYLRRAGGTENVSWLA